MYPERGTYEVLRDGSVRSISLEAFELSSFKSLMSSIALPQRTRFAARVKPGRLSQKIPAVTPVDISGEVAAGIRIKPKRILL
jgi:hypothetical protein